MEERASGERKGDEGRTGNDERPPLDLEARASPLVHCHRIAFLQNLDHGQPPAMSLTLSALPLPFIVPPLANALLPGPDVLCPKVGAEPLGPATGTGLSSLSLSPVRSIACALAAATSGARRLGAALDGGGVETDGVEEAEEGAESGAGSDGMAVGSGPEREGRDEDDAEREGPALPLSLGLDAPVRAAVVAEVSAMARTCGDGGATRRSRWRCPRSEARPETA